MEDNSDKRKVWRELKQAYRKNRKEYTLVFSTEYAVQLEILAKEKGMPVPEFIRSLLKAYQNDTGYILPKENELKALILEMRKIGNNINQIARYINTNKTISIHDFKTLQDRLTDLEKLIVSSLTYPGKKE